MSATTNDDTAEPCLAAPDIRHIRDAAEALQGVATHTPLLRNPEVDQSLGGCLMIKAELLQRTGSFKFRGAYNRMRQISDSARERGVIAYSSGNHAQAVARVANLLDMQAHIVMPDDAPVTKIERTRAAGAKITSYQRLVETREAVAQRIGAEQNHVMVPPNEDQRVMAGAGTVALELLEQAAATGSTPDAILVPCGGGGLSAATAITAAALSPSTRVYGVEPELFDDTRRSLKAGERLANPTGRSTICDAIMTDIPGELTFPINQQLLSGVLTVSDAEVRHAMRLAYEEFRIVIEPGAAVGLAAVLSAKIDISGRAIAVIATGGNVDAAGFCAAIREN